MMGVRGIIVQPFARVVHVGDGFPAKLEQVNEIVESLDADRFAMVEAHMRGTSFCHGPHTLSRRGRVRQERVAGRAHCLPQEGHMAL